MRLLLAILGLVLVTCAAMTSAFDSVDAGAGVGVGAGASARTGREIYQAACTSCHGPDGRGQPQSTVGFDAALPDFTDCGFATAERDQDWRTIVAQGGPVRALNRKMPSFADALTPEEIARVVAYVRGFCADRRWPRGDLNLPRPLVTEKAFPENEAVVTTTFQRGQDGSVGNSFVYEHRLGSRAQYEVVVPFDLQKSAGAWRQGLGDMAVAVKQTLWSDLEQGGIVSVGGEVTLPTGKESEGLGGGVTVLEPFVAFSQRLPSSGFLHVHTGLEHSTNHDRMEDEVYLRTALGRSFMQPRGGRTWSPMIELLGTRELAHGQPIEWDAVPQLQLTLSRRQHIMINGGVQLPLNEREGRHRRVLAYFLWDWFDGGLLSGW